MMEPSVNQNIAVFSSYKIAVEFPWWMFRQSDPDAEYALCCLVNRKKNSLDFRSKPVDGLPPVPNI